MCGINEVIHLNGADPQQLSDEISTMLDRTKHRGPDQSDVVILGQQAALGMNRLSIVAPDEQATVQTSGSGNYAVFNGEIVNHQSLRRNLNTPPLASGDTAIILPMLEEKGEDFVRELAGMFAIGIYNPSERRLQLWRDPLGVKPLYYYQDEQRVIFSSEMKAIAAILPHDPAVDFAAIDHILMYRSHPGRTTVFPEIHRVLPGEKIVFNGNSRSHEHYWTLGENSDALERGNHVEEFRQLLTQVVKEHAQADVPGGLFVSGGLDSSLLAAIVLKEASSSPYKQPISLRFAPNPVVDEDYAKLLEKFLAVPFEWVDVTDEGARQALMDLIPYMDEPLQNPIHVGTFLMARRAREMGIKSIITGDGSDELFLGYSRFEPWFSQSPDKEKVYLKSLQFMTPEEAEELYTQEAKYLISAMSDAQGRPFVPFESLNQALRYERGYHLPDDHNMRVDLMTMANGVEARVPFQDHRVAEYSLKIPPLTHFGISGKAWLQEVAKPWLPPEIIARRKIHFPSLPDQWLSGKGADWAAEILLDPNCRIRRWIKIDTLENYLREHKENTRKHGRLLWALTTLELWLCNLPSWRSSF